MHYNPWLNAEDPEKCLFVSVHGYGKKERHFNGLAGGWFYPGSGETTDCPIAGVGATRRRGNGGKGDEEEDEEEEAEDERVAEGGGEQETAGAEGVGVGEARPSQGGGLAASGEVRKPVIGGMREAGGGGGWTLRQCIRAGPC